MHVHESKLFDEDIELTNSNSVEPRFNEPLFDENLDITSGILCPSNSKIYEKEPRYNEPSI